MAAKTRKPHKKHRPRLVTERTDWQTPFLTELALRANITDACIVAGIDRQTYYNWARHRKDAKAAAFRERVQDALETARDVLRREIHRRAVDGVPRKQFTKSGQPIIDPETQQQYVEREYSDHLLANLAKSHLPEFKDVTRLEHTDGEGKSLKFVLTVATPNGNTDPNPAEAG